MTGPSSDGPSLLEIGGASIPPGSRSRLNLPVARLTTGSLLSLPLEVVHGAEPGPTLWLSGAIHGDELDGVEIVRRVLEHLRPERLAGTVLAAPIVNVWGFEAGSRYLPDRRDLNRSFPGGKRGSMASRLAHLFMTEVVKRCEYGVDFHCGSDQRENLPQVRADLEDDQTRRLALAFGAPVAVHNNPPDGSLRRAAVKAGARVVLFEAGEAGRFNPSAIESGIRGVSRLLEALEMVPGSSTDEGPPSAPEVIEVRKSRWVRAGRSGILRLEIELGERVNKDQHLGTIGDAFFQERHPVKAPKAGIVLGRRVNPLVYQGEGLVHLGDL